MFRHMPPTLRPGVTRRQRPGTTRDRDPRLSGALHQQVAPGARVMRAAPHRRAVAVLVVDLGRHEDGRGRVDLWFGTYVRAKTSVSGE